MTSVAIIMRQMSTLPVKIVGVLTVVIIILSFILGVGHSDGKVQRGINFWHIVVEDDQTLYKQSFFYAPDMSAIKTHETFNIVSGDDITFENDDGEHVFQVKSLLIERQRPSICQIFAEKENAGSMSRATTVYNAKIENIVPGSTSTEFSVKAKVNDSFHVLKLKTVRSESSECIIS